MKRIKAACICQTLHFMLKEDIVEQSEQADGSIVVKVIKQYNTSPIGDYLTELSHTGKQMANKEYIKRIIKQLYETNPNVHINVKLKHPKLTVNTTPAVIKVCICLFSYRTSYEITISAVFAFSVNTTDIVIFNPKVYTR